MRTRKTIEKKIPERHALIIVPIIAEKEEFAWILTETKNKLPMTGRKIGQQGSSLYITEFYQLPREFQQGDRVLTSGMSWWTSDFSAEVIVATDTKKLKEWYDRGEALVIAESDYWREGLNTAYLTATYESNSEWQDIKWNMYYRIFSIEWNEETSKHYDLVSSYTYQYVDKNLTPPINRRPDVYGIIDATCADVYLVLQQYLKCYTQIAPEHIQKTLPAERMYQSYETALPTVHLIKIDSSGIVDRRFTVTREGHGPQVLLGGKECKELEPFYRTWQL